MTAKDLLDLNGDFRRSPLLDTARKLHKLLEQQDIPYLIIGGLSVADMISAAVMVTVAGTSGGTTGQGNMG